MRKVIPQGLNYADVKPEVIDHDVKINTFLPVQTGQYRGNELIRFQLQGTGFLDPYSTYLRFKVTVPNNVNVRPQSVTEGGHVAGRFLDRSAHSFISRLRILVQGQELEDISQYDVLAAMINDVLYSNEQKSLHHYEGFTPKKASGAWIYPTDSTLFNNACRSYQEMENLDRFWGQYLQQDASGVPDAWHIKNANEAYELDMLNNDDMIISPYMVNPASNRVLYSLTSDNAGVGNTQTEAYFILPLYSSILGVLMPTRKLVPMSLMNMELELTINPYALYTTHNNIQREFTISEVELVGHVLMFEQELHRSLEAVVAEHGIFIHLNTFRLAPVALNTQGGGNTIGAYAQINQHHKSINSVHFVFLYEAFRTNSSSKKLSFVSHNLEELQVRNGIELIPNRPIRGTMGGTSNIGNHSSFMIEMYKAWGKMHDPATDGAINAFNYTIDRPLILDRFASGTGQGAGHALIIQADIMMNTGRCQYAISFEGEQLGGDGSALSGKKGLVPFDINFKGTKTSDISSAMLIFCKIDLLLFVRPDLVVQVLGL